MSIGFTRSFLSTLWGERARVRGGISPQSVTPHLNPLPSRGEEIYFGIKYGPQCPPFFVYPTTSFKVLVLLIPAFLSASPFLPISGSSCGA